MILFGLKLYFSYLIVWVAVMLAAPNRYTVRLGTIGFVGMVPLILNMIWGWF